MRNLLGVIISAIVISFVGMTFIKCHIWFMFKQKDYIASYMEPLCKQYNEDLKQWKKEHGQEFINRIKKNEPELFDRYQDDFNKGLDHLFPTN